MILECNKPAGVAIHFEIKKVINLRELLRQRASHAVQRSVKKKVFLLVIIASITEQDQFWMRRSPN